MQLIRADINDRGYINLRCASPPHSPSEIQQSATLNGWSWSNLSRGLWVGQPVGTEFSQGNFNVKVCCSIDTRYYANVVLIRESYFEWKWLCCSTGRLYATILGSLPGYESEEALSYEWSVSHPNACKITTFLLTLIWVCGDMCTIYDVRAVNFRATVIDFASYIYTLITALDSNIGMADRKNLLLIPGSVLIYFY